MHGYEYNYYIFDIVTVSTYYTTIHIKYENMINFIKLPFT